MVHLLEQHRIQTLHVTFINMEMKSDEKVLTVPLCPPIVSGTILECLADSVRFYPNRFIILGKGIFAKFNTVQLKGYLSKSPDTMLKPFYLKT
jgi:hypothetical protein